jgi:hypothetical protein
MHYTIYGLLTTTRQDGKIWRETGFCIIYISGLWNKENPKEIRISKEQDIIN